MAMGFEWELVQESADRNTKRLQVPGGWVYLVTEKRDSGAGGILSQTLTFVPMPSVGSLPS